MTRWVRQAVTTRRIAVVAIGGALALGAAAVAAWAGPRFDLPGFVTAEKEVPASRPKDGQQVAVVIADLRTVGRTVKAEVKSTKVIDSFAPKSVQRDAGDWEVRVTGERDLKYRVPNPLTSIEAENPDDKPVPFEGVRVESYEWTLVVPLYHEGKPLNAETIEVVDLVTGESILRASVPQD